MNLMSPGQRWELGSEFHWHGYLSGPFDSFPEPTVWHLLGRHALIALGTRLEGTEYCGCRSISVAR